MPFITNDLVTKLVDDEEYENNLEEKYKGFVIARKLYMSVDFDLDEPVSDYLYRRFKKFGDIESVEVRKCGNNGYVTFVDDRNACFAYDRENDYYVQVAYTWKQPKQQQRKKILIDDETDEPMEESLESALLNLNDDCMFAIFAYCDSLSLVNLSETCIQMNKLLKCNYHFPKHKTFSTNSGNITTTLADARRTLRLMGAHIETLDLRFRFPQFDDSTPVLRYLQQIVKYCGKQSLVREMLLDIQFWDDDDFRPILLHILTNLQILRLKVIDENVLINRGSFELCKHLKKIVLDNVGLGNVLRMTSHTLESFCLMDDQFDLFAFFQQNQQLKEFKCVSVYSLDLPNIALNLPNVEKLMLILRDFVDGDFLHLNRFESLTKLELRFPAISDADKLKICKYLSGFNNLLELKLFFQFNESLSSSKELQQTIVATSRNICNLKLFALTNIGLDVTTVLNFVRFAANLETLHLHNCNIYDFQSLITGLVNVRKSTQRYTRLNLFMDGGSQSNLLATRDVEAQRYLNIHFGCDHEYEISFKGI